MNGGRKKVIEALKTALIIILVATAAFMVPRVEPMRDLFAGISLRNITQQLTHRQGTELSIDARPDMCMPLHMAYTFGEGRCVFQYNADSMSSTYSHLGTAVSEALGSSEGFEPADEEQWRSALAKEGLYLDYGADVPLEILSAWMGTSAPENFEGKTAHRILLAKNGDKTDLYIMPGESGEVFRCSTALRFATLSSVFAGMEPTGGSFAFELGDGFEKLQPYNLIINREYTAKTLNVLIPAASSDSVKNLLKALDVNTAKASPYPEADGTLVYVESDCTVRLSGDGFLTYKAIAENGTVSVEMKKGLESVQAAAEALAIAESSGVLSGSGVRAYLESVSRDEGGITVKFGRMADGIPVRRNDGESFIEMTVTDGVVTYFSMDLTELAPGEDRVSVMPERMAAAANKSRGELVLAYIIDAYTASLSWIVE